METNLVLILNTHMPWVLGESQIFDEPENWLFEAITECYIPLLKSLSNWNPKRAPGKRIVLSFTPCLIEQLSKCKDRYMAYLEVMRKIASHELERCNSLASYNKYQKNLVNYSAQELAFLRLSSCRYLDRINDAIEFVSAIDLVDFLKKVVSNKPDSIELWTSSPNHNFLPFFNDKTRRYFIGRGVELFQDAFNRHPDGFWLPECAFMPGMDKDLIAAGVTRTSASITAIGPYQPNFKSGHYRFNELDVYIHDFRIAMNIWQAADKTIPSNPVYREFYRDVGMDVTSEFFSDIGVSISNRQNRKSGVWTGIKQHANSGIDVHLGQKSIYDVVKAESQAVIDVNKFLRILDDSRDQVHDRKTFIMAYDTEIFGHWWHEGASWLKHLLSTNVNEKEIV